MKHVVDRCKIIKAKTRCREVALEFMKLATHYNAHQLSDLDVVENTEKFIVLPYHPAFKTKKRVCNEFLKVNVNLSM